MPSAPPRKPNRYELPLSNMVGAMIIVVAFVMAFVVFRALNRDNTGVQPEPVDYHAMATGGRADGRINVWAPVSLSQGWMATSARYDSGTNPHWHLSTTDGTHYLGVEEGIDQVTDELQRVMQGTPVAAGQVTLKGVAWLVYTDSRGDYALARTMPSKTPRYPEALVVVGTTNPEQVQAFAESLTN